MLPQVLDFVLSRGDLAHLALFFWALSSTILLFAILAELTMANRRFDVFIKELSEFNRTIGKYNDV